MAGVLSLVEVQPVGPQMRAPGRSLGLECSACAVRGPTHVEGADSGFRQEEHSLVVAASRELCTAPLTPLQRQV